MLNERRLGVRHFLLKSRLQGAEPPEDDVGLNVRFRRLDDPEQPVRKPLISRHSRNEKLPGQKHPKRGQRRTQDALYDRGTGGRQVMEMPRVTVRSKTSSPASQFKGPNSIYCLPRDLCRQEIGEQIIVIGL